tara:strand:- start:3189 stop:7598 length:4410 start_codon:yes stop_codon:yes gene_type:complete
LNRSAKRLGSLKIPKVGSLDSIGSFGYLVPISILIIASILRLYGIQWDQGGLFHPDERAILFHVNDLSFPHWKDLGVLIDANNSPLNPKWFPYGSLILYLTKIVETTASIFYNVSLTDLSLIGRGLSAFADIGTVFMTFMICSTVYNRKVGYLASLLVSLSVIHIQLSHFFVVDTYLTFLITTSLYFIIKIARFGGTKNSVYAGIFIGLALAIKISIAPIFIALFVAYVLLCVDSMPDLTTEAHAKRNHKLGILKLLTISIGMSILVFVITTPYALLDWYRSDACIMPFSFLNFLSYNEYACSVGGEFQMARGESGRPYTQQYIDTIPFFYQMRQLVFFGLGPLLGVFAWFSLAFMSFAAFYRRRKSDIVLIAWILPYFILTGYLEVKFLRYMLPITPVMLIFVSQTLFILGTWSKENRKRLYLGIQIFIALLIASTLFNALAFMNIYHNDHTAFRASAWINQNVSTGSVILMEHWEEGLPNLHGYIAGCRGDDSDYFSCMKMYDSDQTIYPSGKSKIELVASQLSNADYLVFFSNRLYGTIPRLESKYPYSSIYYRALFAGQLGYSLEHYEQTHPSFFGLTFSNDTFSRPNLDPPDLISSSVESTFTLNMGYADESFDVYDHPTVLILKNKDKLSERDIIDAIFDDYLTVQEDNMLMMSIDMKKVQQENGTWTDIIYLGDVPSYISITLLYLIVIVLGLITFPIVFFVFMWLPDKGYAFSKIFGLLFVSYLSFVLSSYQLMAFSIFTILVSCFTVILCSVLALYFFRFEIKTFIEQNFKHIVVTEVIFTISFLAFIWIRSANPDLWHPYIGGEKSMDMAYITAIVKSTYMPPYDPWFSGGYMNYYYFGYFVVASLIKVSGILPEVAYNVSIGIFFAITTSSVFSLVYNLTKSSAVSGLESVKRMNPTLAGIIGVFFVAVFGNIDGLIQLIQAFWGVLFNHGEIELFDFWRSSRMIPPTGNPIGYAITEFPFFTFLFADLHSHLMAIPFSILILAITFGFMMRSQNEPRMVPKLIHLAILGLSLGTLMMTNTWDYPTYLIIVGISIISTALLSDLSRDKLRRFLNAVTEFSFVVLTSILFFLPYLENYESFTNGVSFSLWQTPIYSYVGIHSLFLFVIGTYLLINPKRDINSGLVLSPNKFGEYIATAFSKTSNILVLSLLFSSCMTLMIYGYTTALFLLGFMLLASIKLHKQIMRANTKNQEIFVLILVLLGFGIGLGVELITIQGDITRMNTVFKFYLQAWLLLGIAASYIIWHLSVGFMVSTDNKEVVGYKFGFAWKGVLLLLILACAIYPIMGTHDRIQSRFNPLPNTLNGLDYMKSATYMFDDGRGAESLRSDHDAVIWIRNNIEGSPVILEGQGQLYRTLHNRVSIYTGLPTVLGWDNHQGQQRGYSRSILERKRDIEAIYSSSDIDRVMSLINKYDITYIYIGGLEKHYYKAEGLKKFDQNKRLFGLLYFNDEVSIYKIYDQ